MMIEIHDYVTQQSLTTVECEAVPRKWDFLLLDAPHFDDEQRAEALRRVEYVEWVRMPGSPKLIPIVSTSKVHGRP